MGSISLRFLYVVLVNGAAHAGAIPTARHPGLSKNERVPFRRPIKKKEEPK